MSRLTRRKIKKLIRLQKHIRATNKLSVDTDDSLPDEYDKDKFTERFLLHWYAINLNKDSKSQMTAPQKPALFMVFHYCEELKQFIFQFKAPQLHLIIPDQPIETHLEACLMVESTITGEWYVFDRLIENVEQSGTSFQLASQFILFLKEQNCPIIAWSVDKQRYYQFSHGNLLWQELSQTIIPLKSSYYLKANQQSLETLMNKQSNNTVTDLNVIAKFSNRSIQAILREMSFNELIILLTNSKPQIKEKFLKNMSPRAREMMNEELNLDRTIRDEKYCQIKNSFFALLTRMIDSGDINYIEPK